MSGLTNGTAYQFRVVARNSVGDRGDIERGDRHTGSGQFDPGYLGGPGWCDGQRQHDHQDGIQRLDEWRGRPRSSGSPQTAGWNSMPDRPIWTSSAGYRRATRMRPIRRSSMRFYMAYNGHIYIYESGTLRGDFGTYTSADTLSVERIGTTIRL